ncbi:MAG: DUF5615 family PIN-like protein [Anaerolineae bacterium]
MAKIRLYTDENITDLLARVLRGRGFDALSAHEAGMQGKTDGEQLAFAVAHQRTLLTFDVGDFVKLASRYHQESLTHFGIVVSDQLEFGELLRRVLNLLETRSAEEMRDRFEWLQNYRQLPEPSD